MNLFSSIIFHAQPKVWTNYEADRIGVIGVYKQCLIESMSLIDGHHFILSQREKQPLQNKIPEIPFFLFHH